MGDKIILDGHKMAWHGERVEAWLRGERVAPIEIECSLTRKCNYNCVYCYGKLQENEEKKLDEEVIFNFLDDAAEIGVKSIALIGDGENTCSPHLYKAIARGKNNGIDMALATNGSLLKRDKLEEILPSLTYLRFSISAGEPARYKEIMGSKDGDFQKVCETISEAVRIKKERGLETTIGLQMVLMPRFADQVMPLAKLGKELGADYLVIKHCSDDELGSLGVDYTEYQRKHLTDILHEAEKESNENYLVRAKWTKLLSGGSRCYTKCYGPVFSLQISGSGLVAPCGFFFNEQYKKYHIGNIAETRFKEIWQSEKYWDVMKELSSETFDANTMCGKLCFQHKVNEYLDGIKKGTIKFGPPSGNKPLHVNFI